MSARRPRGPPRRGHDTPNSPDASITDDATPRDSLQSTGRGNIPGRTSTGVQRSTTGQNTDGSENPYASLADDSNENEESDYQPGSIHEVDDESRNFLADFPYSPVSSECIAQLKDLTPRLNASKYTDEMRRNVYRVFFNGAPVETIVGTLPTLSPKPADRAMQQQSNRPIFGSKSIPENLFTGAVSCANGGKFTPGVRHELEKSWKKLIKDIPELRQLFVRNIKFFHLLELSPFGMMMALGGFLYPGVSGSHNLQYNYTFSNGDNDYGDDTPDVLRKTSPSHFKSLAMPLTDDQSEQCPSSLTIECGQPCPDSFECFVFLGGLSSTIHTDFRICESFLTGSCEGRQSSFPHTSVD